MIRKHGGMWFFRFGRLGGSFYLKRLSVTAEVERQMANDYHAWVLSHTLPVTAGIWSTILFF